jgi:hypothetical protein
MNLSRRSVVTGILAAPIVIRSGLLMPVKALPLPMHTFVAYPSMQGFHVDYWSNEVRPRDIPGSYSYCEIIMARPKSEADIPKMVSAMADKWGIKERGGHVDYWSADSQLTHSITYPAS